MRKAFLLLLIVASFAGCRKEHQVGPKEGQKFVNLLFPDQASCTQFQQSTGGMVFNCHQSIEFKENNVVDMMVTDILNRGSYKQAGDIIMISFEGPNDVQWTRVLFIFYAGL